MENASKALLMAAEVLVGVLLLSLMAVLFFTFINYQSEVTTNQAQKELYQFNSKFEAYKNTDLTAQDVLSIYNLARDYNKKFEGETRINVKVQGITNDKITANSEFLNSNNKKTYIIEEIRYNNKDSKVNYIKIIEK